MVKEDIHNLRTVLDRHMERYLSGFSPKDRDDVRRFLDDLLIKGYTPGRVNKYLYSLVSIRKQMNKPFKQAKEGDIKQYVAWLEKSDYKDWTKRDLKIILRIYLRWLGKEDLISLLKVKQPKNGVLPEEILTEDDIKAIAGVAYTTRDKAFVLSLYDSGCRIGEFLPLKLKHINFDKYGTLLRVTGKTGDRRVRLVASTLALQTWLNDHPCKADPDAYPWCKIPTLYNPKNKTLPLGAMIFPNMPDNEAL